MPGSAIIGALRVVLGLDSAALDTGAKEAQAKLQKLNTSMIAAGTAIGTTLASMASKVGSAVKGALEEISQLGKISSATGVPIEQLSALSYAAKQAGASTETLGAGLKGLGASMLEAAGNARSDAARSFAALGVAFRDAAGNLRPINDVLLDVADKFKQMPNGPQKAGIAFTLLKDAGYDLIGMLSRGRDWIQQASDAAAELGIVIDGDTKNSVKRFNENVKQVNSTFSVFTTQMAARLAPTMESISAAFLGVVKNGESLNAIGSVVSVTLKGLATGGEVLVGIFNILKEVIAKVSNALSLVLSGEFKKAFAVAAEGFKNVDRIITESDNNIDALWSGAGEKAKKAAEVATSAWQPWVESTREMKDRLAEARAELQALIDTPTVGIAEKMVAVEEAWRGSLISMAQHVQMTNDVIKQFHTESRAALDTLLNTPSETFQTKMDAINEALQQGSLNAKQFGDATKKINDENRQNWENLAGTVATALTTIFNKSKVAAIASIILNTAEGISKALAKGGFFGFAQAAIIAATGAAQIATVRSTSLTGGGSTPSLSSGAGGGGATGGAAAMPVAPQTLLVKGLSAGSWFSGEAVRELAEQLVAYQRDGGRVVFGDT